MIVWSVNVTEEKGTKGIVVVRHKVDPSTRLLKYKGSFKLNKSTTEAGSRNQGQMIKELIKRTKGLTGRRTDGWMKEQSEEINRSTYGRSLTGKEQNKTRRMSTEGVKSNTGQVV